MARGVARGMICVALVAGLYAQADEKQDAVALVEKAIQFHKKNGSEKTLAEINVQNGAFDKGELYVFVYDFNGVVMAHPKNPKLIGKNLLEMPDLNGKMFRKDIITLAKKQGTGWVDYQYKNPESGKSEAKTTYFKASGELVFCCGVYQ